MTKDEAVAAIDALLTAEFTDTGREYAHIMRELLSEGNYGDAALHAGVGAVRRIINCPKFHRGISTLPE